MRINKLTAAVTVALATTLPVMAQEAEEQDKLARKKHGSNDYKSNIAEW